MFFPVLFCGIFQSLDTLLTSNNVFGPLKGAMATANTASVQDSRRTKKQRQDDLLVDLLTFSGKSHISKFCSSPNVAAGPGTSQAKAAVALDLEREEVAFLNLRSDTLSLPGELERSCFAEKEPWETQVETIICQAHAAGPPASRNGEPVQLDRKGEDGGRFARSSTDPRDDNSANITHMSPTVHLPQEGLDPLCSPG